MMNKTRLAAALAAALLSGSLLAQTVVTVNGTKIDSSELERRAQFVIANSQGRVQDSAELRNYIANETVVETVVTQEAKRLGLDKTTEFKNAQAASLKQVKAQGIDKRADFKQLWADHTNQLLMQAYAVDVVKKNPVTDAQVQQQYDSIRSRYENTDEAQLGQIVTDKMAQAKAAERELKAKKSFATVAQKYSINPQAKAGHTDFSDYIPMRDLQELNPLVYGAVAKLKKGQVSQPVTGNSTFAVFFMNDRRKVTVQPLDKIREPLRASMANDRVQAAIGNLMSQAKIVPASK